MDEARLNDISDAIDKMNRERDEVYVKTMERLGKKYISLSDKEAIVILAAEVEELKEKVRTLIRM